MQYRFLHNDFLKSSMGFKAVYKGGPKTSRCSHYVKLKLIATSCGVSDLLTLLYDFCFMGFMAY